MFLVKSAQFHPLGVLKLESVAAYRGLYVYKLCNRLFLVLLLFVLLLFSFAALPWLPPP